jgi:preprotein translocase subunit SecA
VGVGDRRFALWRGRVAQIDALGPELESLADDMLRKRSLELRFRAKCREPLDALLVDAFALVREAGRRRMGMRHFDVQLLAGMALVERSIAEMQTGEGKTLTATLPVYLFALAGHGAHVATVNDYLARRDADLMRPIYELLGLSVGVIEADVKPAGRRAAYACDVTYGTAKEYGFDFLRDQLLRRQGRDDGGSRSLMLGDRPQPVQRDAHFALVDEADSVLIDDASTPLVIAAAPTGTEKLAAASFVWSAKAAGQFVEDEHYRYDHRRRSVTLSGAGRKLLRALPRPGLEPLPLTEAYEYIERAIRVARDYIRDRHFVIRDGEVVIVDEFTGRIAEGRKWRDGIHQAVEAMEGVEVTVATGQAARITVQEFFKRYEHLCGMTGTAASSSAELSTSYDVRVLQVPTHRPAIREALPDVVYGTSQARWEAVVEETREMHATGRPVLIGTRSIDKSELLSKLLRAAGIEHDVLNARHIAREAEIVSHAGEMGRVTVSTNMAGRGTDIKLGPGVHELGGLHVICTEVHDSPRIDRQLIGRCGRQGDPGSYRQFMAMDDDVLRAGLGPDEAERLEKIGLSSKGSLDRYASRFREAQRKIERRAFRQRRVLMYFEGERAKAQREMGLDPHLDMAA